MTKINEVIQSPLFAKQKKKLHKKQIHGLDQAIKDLMKEPELGEAKTGDLKGIRVYKIRIEKDQILLAYECIDHILYLFTFGLHENFYQTLKKYRKSQK